MATPATTPPFSSAEALVPSPAPAARGGRGGRGKARGGRAPPPPKKGKITKTTKQPSARGRRAKVYDNLKAQAAHERMGELKNAFNIVTRAMKPALNELAERSLKQLTEEPELAELTPEAAEIHQFLDGRFAETISSIDQERDRKINLATKMLERNIKISRDAYQTKMFEAEMSMLDAQMARIERLDYLHSLNLPVDLSDVSYDYREATQDFVDSQGPYVHYNKSGEYIPAVEKIGITVSQLQNPAYQLPEESSLRRKAGSGPDGLPSPKRVAVEQDLLPVRHVKSMLSAVEEIPDRSSSQGAAQAAEGHEDSSQEQQAVNGDADEGVFYGLPVPKGASAPDEFGVRLINKPRDKRANNRIMAPNPVILDDWQIGFRDSTNHPDKGATRARRGDYINQANSNAMFYDRRVADWTSTMQKEEDYDQELVRKHRLHPRLGIFLPSSVNKFEKSIHKDFDEYLPVVHVGPKGEIMHSSRFVPAHRLDVAAEREEALARLQPGMKKILEEIGATEEELAADKEVRVMHRLDELATRDMSVYSLPTPRRCVSPQQMPKPETSPSRAPQQLPQREIIMLDDSESEDVTINGSSEEALARVNEILEAAAAVEESEKEKERQAREEEEETAREAAARPRAQSQAQGRPYDAVRDLFTMTSSPVIAPSEPVELLEPSDPAEANNTYALSLLADLAEETAEEERRIQELEAEDTSMVDPAILGSSMGESWPKQPQAPPQPELEQLPQPQQLSIEVPLPAQGRINDFLRTTLNPQTPSPVYPPPPSMPGQSEYPSPQLRGALPSLRPQTASPDFGTVSRPSYDANNSGPSSYPPPAPRPYHSSYLSDQQYEPIAAPTAQPPYHLQQYPSPMQSEPQPQPPARLPFGVQLTPYIPKQYPPVAGGPTPTCEQPAYTPHIPGLTTRVPRPPPANTPVKMFRKLEPARGPPPPRSSSSSSKSAAAAGNKEPQVLRTIQYHPPEAIKDYVPTEAPPTKGPKFRGWSHQTQTMKAKQSQQEDHHP